MYALSQAVRRFVTSSKSLPIPSSCFIHPSAVVIGLVSLGENCSVWPTAVLRGDGNYIYVGDNSNIQDGTIVHTVGEHRGPGTGIPTIVGRNVSIGHSVTLHACTIEDHVLVGNGAIVLDGAVVKSDTVIAAGSVVAPGKVVTGGLWMGSPAKFKRDLTSDELEWIRRNYKLYVQLKDHFLQDKPFPFTYEDKSAVKE